jgi:transcriptional regulator GlxA family with amidase domain
MARARPRPRPRRIAILVYDGIQSLDVTGPLEVFALANLELAVRCGATVPAYVIELVGPDTGPVTTHSGLLFGTLLLLCAAMLGDAASAVARPVVAVLAQNTGTEITDFLVPYGVIASAGTAEVIAVSTEAGAVELFPGPLLPGLSIAPVSTIEAFDREHPEGAAFVIVPAFRDSQLEMTRVWLRAQADKGATLVSICDGALVLAGTGLLDGHRATGHFASADQRRKAFPNVHWVANTRFVHDGRFISSAGVSASLPAALYVVELLAGRARAVEVGQAHGLSGYDATHDSDAFRFGVHEYWITAKNLLFGWPRDVYALELVPGVDEVGLAFTFDMLSRTFFSEVLPVGATREITTRHGLRVLRSAATAGDRAVSVRIGGPARSHEGLTVGEGARAVDDVLTYLTKRYGKPLSTFVATQLEYSAFAPK